MLKYGKFHIGLRAVKTALAVGLALLTAHLLGSSLPIFAVIGAISVMSRNLNDSLRECLIQLTGTVIGFVVATVFVRVLPDPSFFLWMGLGTLLVIALCLRLNVQFAVPLASIVFADICLYGGGNDQVWYGFHRFTDTVIGLLVALAVNMAIKPYNNQARIVRVLGEIRDAMPSYLDTRYAASLSSLPGSLRFMRDSLFAWAMRKTVSARRRPTCAAVSSLPSAWSRSCPPCAAWTSWARRTARISPACARSG